MQQTSLAINQAHLFLLISAKKSIKPNKWLNIITLMVAYE